MKVVIDTDAGVDDALALLLALHGLEREDIVGITTVFGNVDLHQANHNVAHILEAAGRTEVPVFSGAGKAMISSVSDERWGGHGPDGLGGAAGTVEAAAAVLRRNDAVHALIELSQRYKGELVVVALGPMTNVALATLIDPEFVANVKQFVVMGGLSRGEGNLTPHSEFNVGCDPEATDILYQHCTADKLFVFPFETTTDHALTWTVFDEVFAHASTAVGAYLRDVWGFTRAFTKDTKFGFVPCDAYAVAMLLHPNYITQSSVRRGRIHLGHDAHRGDNIWDDSTKGGANVTVVTHIDKNIFIDLLHRLAV